MMVMRFWCGCSLLLQFTAVIATKVRIRMLKCTEHGDQELFAMLVWLTTNSTVREGLKAEASWNIPLNPKPSALNLNP